MVQPETKVWCDVAHELERAVLSADHDSYDTEAARKCHGTNEWTRAVAGALSLVRPSSHRKKDKPLCHGIRVVTWPVWGKPVDAEDRSLSCPQVFLTEVLGHLALFLAFISPAKGAGRREIPFPQAHHHIWKTRSPRGSHLPTMMC